MTSLAWIIELNSFLYVALAQWAHSTSRRDKKCTQILEGLQFLENYFLYKLAPLSSFFRVRYNFCNYNINLRHNSNKIMKNINNIKVSLSEVSWESAGWERNHENVSQCYKNIKTKAYKLLRTKKSSLWTMINVCVTV